MYKIGYIDKSMHLIPHIFTGSRRTIDRAPFSTSLTNATPLWTFPIDVLTDCAHCDLCPYAVYVRVGDDDVPCVWFSFCDGDDVVPRCSLMTSTCSLMSYSIRCRSQFHSLALCATTVIDYGYA